MMNVIYVAAGGAIGSVLRYLIQNWVGAATGKDFPYGTMLVNILGSFVMGALIGWLARTTPENAHDIRLFVAVGVLGGFTTFSSFSLDAITLFEQGRLGEMSAYIFVSVICSLLGLLAGLQLMKAIA